MRSWAGRSLLALTIVTGVTPPLVGQSASAPTSGSARFAAALRLDELTRQASRRDFRWTGTVAGAIGLGIAAGITGAAYCGNSEDGPRSCTGTTIGFALGGAPSSAGSSATSWDA